MFLCARYDNKTLGLTEGDIYESWRVTGTPLIVVEVNDNLDQVIAHEDAFYMEGKEDANY